MSWSEGNLLLLQAIAGKERGGFFWLLFWAVPEK